MKKNVKMSDRATGPVTNVSYKGMAKRQLRNNSAAGDEKVSVVDFLAEDQRGQTLQVSITNTAASDIVLALFPGRLGSIAEIARYAGVQVDAIASEGVVKDASSNNIATVTSKTLDLAKGWVKDVPTRFSLIKLQTDNESQFSKEFGIATFGLGKTTGTRTIRPIEFVTPSQLNKTMCEIEVSMQLDHQTVFFVEIGAGRSLEISLQMVTEMNPAAALNAMVDKLEA
jgi:hypothetical protein